MCVTESLPPSKFGAGYSYGDDLGASPQVPAQQVTPPATAYPSAAPAYPAPAYPAPAYPPPAPAYPSAAPAPGYPGAGYPMVPRPSGGTAIAAGILALLIGLSRGFSAFESFSTLDMMSGSIYGGYGASGDFKAYLTITGIAGAVTALMLIVGAIMLFARSSAGRGLVVFGGIIALIEQAGIVIYLMVQLGNVEYFFKGLFAGLFGIATISAAIGLVIVILMIFLASSGSTKRWCQSKHAPAYGGPVGYP